MAFPIKLPGLPFLKGKEKKKLTGTYEDYESKLIGYLTSPPTIVKHPNEIQADKYHRCIAAINYPRLVEAGWLTRLIEMNLDFDLSIHIAPYSIESTIKMLETELKKQKTDLFGLKTEGKIIPQSLIQKHEDTKALLEAIQSGTEKMFSMALYIDAKSYDLKELDKITAKIRGQMNSIMVTPKITAYQMYKALKSILPIGHDELKITREITSSAASSCFPFAITSLEPHATGILIGFNKRNSIPIIIDPFELSNPNMLVLGTSGGGKSYCIKLMLMREFMESVDINIIDPQAEYTDLIKTFNGKTIKIAPGSNVVINPMDLMGQTLDEKKLSLLAFFRVLMGELKESQRAILDDAIDATYEEIGITTDPRTWSKRPPTLEDLYKQVLPLTRSDKDVIYKPALEIANRMKTYVHGPLRFLNQQTKIDLDNRMISFDIRDIPDVGKGTLMFLLLEYVYNMMKKSKKRKMLVIDEAWMVLSAGEEGEYILRLVKTCRKFNLSLTMITQDVEDVLTSRAGRAVMANTATKLLLKQDTTVIDEITERFHLNEAETRQLRIAGTGDALLIAGALRVPIEIKASPEEHKLITTKPDELLDMVRKAKGPGVEREMAPELDIKKAVQEKTAFTNEQIKTLMDIGFNEVRVSDLEGTSKLYMIKNETEDTDEHFVVQNLARNEIKKYTDKALIHHTKMPDITFESSDGKIVAVEIVADISLKRNIEAIEEKINILRKYDDYFFIVGDPKLVKYESFGEILTRTQVPAKIKSYFEQ
ncbi:MAG: ATP-binding protein [Candidatus Altiarchaeales archaeon]|nr:ATP-binding protein [Candidatus Altiarchaeota archaeon]MBU4341434.1 ATP-binding protein [Candidatus Altiarchaeota archaeon]MCG2782158.1 ATP-binding protein [Candidatus Altiarchaeales archaeon]